jgi:hypothetical protein
MPGAQCRSNQARWAWTGTLRGYRDVRRGARFELALALKRSAGRTRSAAFIPKANGKLRPLGISTYGTGMHDGSDAVLDPIFEADLP